MKIGIDLDNTITEIPEFFSLLSRVMRCADHTVHIVTFRAPKGIENTRTELEEHGIQYDTLHLPAKGESIQAFKGRVALEMDLDIFFDDMPEAFDDMPKKTHRLWLCDPEIYDIQIIINALGSGLLKY